MAAPLNGAAITSFTVIDVVDSDDVVLAEIAAGLNLDQLDVDLAWIGEPVRRANRQVDRFVLVNERHSLVERDLGGAAHDHPVLGAVVVLLQRQAPARPHDNAFDLIARAPVDALIIAPGPVVAPMLGRFRMALRLEALDQLFDFGGLRPVGHENRVAGRDDDPVLEAYYRH